MFSSDLASPCALHPGVAAVFTCIRCGSFGCEVCRSPPNPEFCQTCAARELPRAAALTLSNLLQDTFRLFLGNLPAVGVFVALSQLLTLLLLLVFARIPALEKAAALSPTDRRFLLIGLVITWLHMAMAAGFMRWVADGLFVGARRSVASAVNAGLSSFLALFCMALLFGCVVGTGLFLFILPGLYLAVSMSLAPAALVVDGFNPYAALKHSYAIVRGHRLKLLGLGLVFLMLHWGTSFVAGLVSALLFKEGSAGQWVGTFLRLFMTDVVLCLFSSATIVTYLRITGRPRHDAVEPLPGAEFLRDRFLALLSVVSALAVLLLVWSLLSPHELGSRQPLSSRAAATLRTPPPPTPPLEPPATLANGSFLVRVVAAGQPVEQAHVQAYRRLTEEGTRRQVWRRAGEGATDREGLLRLPATPGLYLLTARAEGHGPARLEVPRYLSELETGVELSLPTVASLEGWVVGGAPAGPVPRVEVTLHPYTEPVTPEAQALALPEEAAIAVSDEGGRFSFTGLAPGRYELVAEASGFTRRTLRAVSVPRTQGVEVVLHRAYSLEGFVMGMNGRGAVGAEVLAQSGLTVLRATTTQRGNFVMDAPEGEYSTVVVRHGGHVASLRSPFTLGAGRHTEYLVLELEVAGGLSGKVRRGSDGAPVEGAWLVAFLAGTSAEMGRGRTDSLGEYELDLPSGRYDVVVGAPGLTGTVREALEVSAGEHQVTDFQLEGSVTVEGRVTDEQARPLAGVPVRAGPARMGLGEERFTRTDASGTYRLEGLSTGSVWVRARREGSVAWLGRTLELKAGARAQVDLTLAEMGRVRGRVAVPSGALPAGPALVRALAKSPLDDAADVVAIAETDAQGRYLLELPAGLYQLTAMLSGEVPSAHDSQQGAGVKVETGAEQVHDLVLAGP